ncbi:cyclase family protein [Staphylococcus agnetis]|uniref:cyclase family protein n=1 Tax=Staphylococcus agnetis TaxID=985762 RepID=UPI000D037144|nr:cyclase family protein [Staphylococcus agnetis]
MWIDITHALSKDWAEWPGDTPFQFNYFATKAQTDSVNIGEIVGSTHIATHVDAPKHFDDDGLTVDLLPVERFIGIATVVTLLDIPVIEVDHLKSCPIEGTIILIQTQRESHPSVFPEEIPVLSIAAIDYLASIGIEVIGVDVPSVDPIDSETLENHHRIAHHEMYNIENLRLAHVKAGIYQFIGLPLKISGADASYIRAVIQPISR